MPGARETRGVLGGGGRASVAWEALRQTSRQFATAPLRSLTLLAALSAVGLLVGALVWMAHGLEGHFDVVVSLGRRVLWARHLPEDPFVRYVFTLRASPRDLDSCLALPTLLVGVVAPRRIAAHAAGPGRAAALARADAWACASALGLALLSLWGPVFNVYSHCFVRTIPVRLDGVPMLLAALVVLAVAPRRVGASDPR